jgi:hypothetical protein
MIQHEENEQIALFEWARLSENRYPELRWMFHIPNGGARHKATAGRLKSAGVKAGVLDIFLPVPKGIYHGMFIEMKHGKNKPTPEQMAWLEYLKDVGYKTAVCYGCYEAIDTIKEYLEEPKMATDAQISYYKFLCEQVYIEPDEDCEDWDNREMSGKIKELKEMAGVDYV